ncbi:MAG: hypothetical protein CVV57_10230 [Tenericutes bacterium HGW-Tenericutes-2]|jgi:hypothetical protein|nr:MAG: hypothetical protein CVV57_10230 [Tenericutes bacterium HGW-Tenericutes-2]
MKAHEFIELIEIKQEEIDKAKHYLDLKGVNLHHSIYSYLSSYTASKIKYCEIATTYRYDKRIRKVLYKYIGLMEEMIRAFIDNKYSDEMDQIKLTTKIANTLKNEKVLYKALDKTLFSDLIAQVLDLSEEDINAIFPNTIFDSKNLKAIAELRNAVSHNRFLLNYLSFKECNIGGRISGSLHANLMNLANHFDIEIRKSFINEINTCAILEDDGDKMKINQVEWCLPVFVVIVL